MRRVLQITPEPIDEAALVKTRIMSDAMGGAVYFSGVVRGSEGESAISGIEYEAFEKMAIHQFGQIFDEVESRWPIESVRLIHRVGLVRVNEASLWVEVVAPHRGEAFSACQFIVEQMKAKVPIWKRPIPAKTA
jgi:molybdopterin synthase catalytic subunit